MGGNKVPGSGGTHLEFYKVTYEMTKDDILDVINQMFIESKVTDQQKYVAIVCVPKLNGTNTPADFRPIILLNNDYKLSARIIANLVRPMLAEMLQPSQYCGVTGNTIFEAVATVREAIAISEVTPVALCILILEFKEAANRVSHTHIYSPY
jgi:hypothetical protein